MLLEKLCHDFGIKVKGIIQIGASVGEEVDEFLSLSSEKMVLVEALPQVIKDLKKKVEGHTQIKIVNCAISNFNGKANYNVTSNLLSSSLLSLKEHKEMFRKIIKVDEILVECKTLDTLLKELHENASDYNFLYIDVQGAEHLVLQGAENLLKHIEAVYTEVNYRETYQECVLEPEVSKFLKNKGFLKVAEQQLSSGQGDVFYVRKSC